MAKTIEEINKKIRKKQAVVVTAEEMIQIVDQDGSKKASEKVDVVTTGTFGPMCSSGAYINIGHTKPKIKIGGGTCTLNDVPAYTGFAAVDILIGCTQTPDDDPRNKPYPGEFRYGGGHVIQDLVAGKNIKLSATAYGTDCYPRKKIETLINIKDINEAVLFNPRNGYQNYNVGINVSNKNIYTYMGVLKANMGNANYCSAGQLSPLLNDPHYKTIGIGTKMYLGGGIGYIVWQGTQHNPSAKRKENGVPCTPAGTIAVIGDLKQMKPEWLVGVSMLGYGTTLMVGLGIPIPVLNEEIALHTAVRDEEIFSQVVDYSDAYPNGKPGSLCEASYAQLRSGSIIVNGKEVKTASLSSYPKAVEIADSLKEWIEKGEFLLSESVAPLPGVDSDYSVKPLNERPVD